MTFLLLMTIGIQAVQHRYKKCVKPQGGLCWKINICSHSVRVSCPTYELFNRHWKMLQRKYVTVKLYVSCRNNMENYSQAPVLEFINKYVFVYYNVYQRENERFIICCFSYIITHNIIFY